MIRTQEATGKTVDEARAKACALLGVQADDLNVSYEVLEMPQKTGFLGLKTTPPAKVRVSVEEPDAPAAPVVEEKVEPEVKPVVEEAPAEEPKAEEPAAAPVAEEAAPAEETADPAAEGEEPEVPINIEENAKVKAAVDYLKEVIALMGVENVTFSAVQKGEATIIRLDGEKLGALIGRRGETMESLSYLASLVANRLPGEYIKLGLDVAGYRGKREKDLTVLAQRIGNKVRKTGRSFAMEPMNPYERRIIHSAIGKMEGVRSESKGEGRDRRVVIYSTAPDAQTDNTYGERRPRGAMAAAPAATAMAASAADAAAAPGMAVPAMAVPQAAAVPVLPACLSAPMLPVTQRLPHPWHPSAPSAWMILPISALARSSCKLR